MNSGVSHHLPDLLGPNEAFRGFERLARRVLDLVPVGWHARTRDVVEIAYDWEGETYVVLVTPEAVELRLPSVDWVTPYTPVKSSTLWKRVALSKVDESALPALIAAARDAYAKKLRTCRYCKEKFPPHHMTDDRTCHGCASKHERVVY